jgi:protoporphyrinogen IX oxidase
VSEEGSVNWYDLARGLHIVAVIAWMAGLLYLPRLFVYHVKHSAEPAVTSVFAVMERNLLRIIMNPAMIAAWVFGLWLLYLRFSGDWSVALKQPWLHVKLLGVVVLTGYHHFLAAKFKKLQRGESIGTEKFWRMINEVPILLALVMVVSVTLEWGSR